MSSRLQALGILLILCSACIPLSESRAVQTEIADQSIAMPLAQTANPATLPDTIIHVSPQGNDDNPGSVDLPVATIAQAQRLVRLINQTMTEPIQVVIHSGMYLLTSPLKFSRLDSGQNGYQVIYEAAEGETPILSGGIQVKGWEQLPGSQLWKTTLPEGTQLFRQLYVNGAHAQRAMLSDAIVGGGYAAGETSDRDGIIVAANAFPELSNPEDVELHWIFDWKDMRLKVSHIQNNDDGTKTIWMLQPYYAQALGMESEYHHWIPAYIVPFIVENALELLDQPGEWYYNAQSRELYYWPKATEDMLSSEVVVPQYEKLMEFKGGTIGQEVHDVTLRGLTFAFSNWTKASETGTFGWQAQFLVGGGKESMTPAQLEFTSVKNISLEKNIFTHLGATAIHFGNNATNILIQGNLFYDIADAAIVIGDWNDAYLKNSLHVQPQNITVSNNLIDSAGAEYWGAAGINAYYVANVKILHNELRHLPYTGISLGWGWSGTTDSTTCRNNLVSNNLIEDIAQKAQDAGGVYTLGQMPGTVISGNVIRRLQGVYACLYPDEGSAFIEFKNNLCDTAPQWLHLWTSSIHDIQITNSYANVSAFENNGTNITLEPLHFVSGINWPAEAQAIIQQAGLESDYTFLRDWVTKLKK